MTMYIHQRTHHLYNYHFRMQRIVVAYCDQIIISNVLPELVNLYSVAY